MIIVKLCGATRVLGDCNYCCWTKSKSGYWYDVVGCVLVLVVALVKALLAIISRTKNINFVLELQVRPQWWCILVTSPSLSSSSKTRTTKVDISSTYNNLNFALALFHYDTNFNRDMRVRWDERLSTFTRYIYISGFLIPNYRCSWLITERLRDRKRDRRQNTTSRTNNNNIIDSKSMTQTSLKMRMKQKLPVTAKSSEKKVTTKQGAEM